MTSQTFLHKLPSTGTESMTTSGYCDRSFPCQKHAHSLSAQTSAEAYSQMLCDVVLDQDECLDKVQEIGILFKKAESQLLTGGGYSCCVDRRYGGGDKGGGEEIRSDVIAMPLFHSISHSSWEVFQALLEFVSDDINYKMNINNADSGVSVLHLATQYANADMMVKILRKGADINIKNRYKETVLDPVILDILYQNHYCGPTHHDPGYKSCKIHKSGILLAAGLNLKSLKTDFYTRNKLETYLYNNECWDLVELLWKCGFKFSKKFTPKITTPYDGAFKNYGILAAYITKVLSLQDLAASVIRYRLFPNAVARIDRLHLPATIRDVVLLNQVLS